MASKHQASKVVVALLATDCAAEDDSVLMDVITMATKVTIRRITDFTSNNVLYFLVGFLVAVAIWLHFRVH